MEQQYKILKELPKITTIIPTYRRPKLLKRAIESVLSQSFGDFQVCVYDNASGDETAEIVSGIAKKEPRVKYFCHNENIGGHKNFHYAIERVVTPFFTILSDDDFLLPDFYEIALDGFRKHPEAIFSAVATAHISDSGDVLDVPMLQWPAGFYKSPYGLVAMLTYGHPTWTGILFRKDVFEKNSFIRESVGVTSDLDFELRVARNGSFVVSRKLGAVFVMHPEGSYVSAGFSGFWPGWLKMVRTFSEDKDLPENIRIYAEKTLNRKLLGHLRRVAMRGALSGDHNDAKKAMDIVLSRSKTNFNNLLLLFFVNGMKYLPMARVAGKTLAKKRREILCRKKKHFLPDVYKDDFRLIRKIMMDSDAGI